MGCLHKIHTTLCAILTQNLIEHVVNFSDVNERRMPVVFKVELKRKIEKVEVSFYIINA